MADVDALVGKARTVQLPADFEAALDQSSRAALLQVREVWGVDPATELGWLQRCRVETGSEDAVLRELKVVCSLLFTAPAEVAIDRLLAYLDAKTTHRITTDSFRADVEALGLGWKAWLDPTLGARVVDATNAYLESLPSRIDAREIATEDMAEVVELALRPNARITLVMGGAGSGKSVAMAHLVAAARERGWPVLAMRVDHHLSATTLEQVGEELVGRAENPVGLLGNRYGDQDTLLLIDQVDAVSEASGRSGRIRELLFRMLDDWRHFPRMRVVAACRSYDFENDTRLKALAASKAATPIRLRALDWEAAVKPVLEVLDCGNQSFSAREKEILSIPINLQVFASIARSGGAPPSQISGSHLFDELLAVKAREIQLQGHSWTPEVALGAMSRWMSENQELTAPVAVLAPFSGAVRALSSAGLISATSRMVQFAHESFFDYIFSSSFVASGHDVVDMLLADEQRLFRRTQVRQIFSRLREAGSARKYLANLEKVMGSFDVRYLVKDAVATWMADLANPSEREFDLVIGWFTPGHPLQRLGRIILSQPAWSAILLRTGRIGPMLEGDDEARQIALWMMWRGATENSALIVAFLRQWWHSKEERATELLRWFAELRPQGEIGELEELYLELIAACPSSLLNPAKFDAAFDLGSWVHTNSGVGARVLGAWLKRWLREFPEGQPFDNDRSNENEYWFKELATQQPEAFLHAVIGSFGTAVRNDMAALETGRILWPTLEIPKSPPYDGFWARIIGGALQTVAASEPEAATALVDLLPKQGAIPTHLRLVTIAANGDALGSGFI